MDAGFLFARHCWLARYSSTISDERWHFTVNSLVWKWRLCALHYCIISICRSHWNRHEYDSYNYVLLWYQVVTDDDNGICVMLQCGWILSNWIYEHFLILTLTYHYNSTDYLVVIGGFLLAIRSAIKRGQIQDFTKGGKLIFAIVNSYHPIHLSSPFLPIVLASLAIGSISSHPSTREISHFKELSTVKIVFY